MAPKSKFLDTMDGSGVSYHELYKVWAGMMDRCYNPKCNKYPIYGARGITVHLPWHCAKVFIDEIEPRPRKGFQIDRIDNNGNYEPGNLRWATRTENIRNRQLTLKVEYMGKIMPVAEVAELTGIHYRALRSRVLIGDPDPFRPVDPSRMRHKAKTQGPTIQDAQDKEGS